SGRLREPLAASRFADAVVLSGAAPPSGRDLAEALAPFGFTGPGFAAETVPGTAHFESGEPLEPPAPVVAVSGLARNAAFHDLARTVGFELVATLELGDHHPYPPATLRRIRELWSRHPASAVLTTAKDRVKLAGRLDLPLATLPISTRLEPGFWQWLGSGLSVADSADRR
ncbi:MAG: tetraacyldisaccharide 4'-kinase, partial [Thermoanaerobaculia bacterium]|nr:tetraacyldisaccharide 4'-kinase [Thermoanaerobaculia bacterium]